MLNINIANDWFWTSDLWYQNATALPTELWPLPIDQHFLLIIQTASINKKWLTKNRFRDQQKSFKTFGCDLELLKAVAFLEEIKEV